MTEGKVALEFGMEEVVSVLWSEFQQIVHGDY